MAEVEYGPFVWPPTLRKGIQSLLVEAVVKGIPRRLHSRFDAALDATDLPRSLDLISGMWFIRVRNEGSLTGSSVSLKLPRNLGFGPMLIRLGREGTESKVLEAYEVVELGDLRPGEVVNLTGWARTGPSEDDARQIRISHASGYGKVNVQALASPLWVWMDRNLSGIIYLSIWTVLFVFSLRQLLLTTPPWRKSKGRVDNDKTN